MKGVFLGVILILLFNKKELLLTEDVCQLIRSHSCASLAMGYKKNSARAKTVFDKRYVNLLLSCFQRLCYSFFSPRQA